MPKRRFFLKLWTLGLLSLIALQSSAQVFEESETDGNQELWQDVHFFKGSKRGAINANEARFLIEIHRSFEEQIRINGINPSQLSPQQEANIRAGLDRAPSCSAFFVKNESGKFIIGTARHCFKFFEIPMCESKTLYDFRPFVARNLRGQCNRIVALDEKSDFLLLEINFPGQDTRELQRKMSALTIAVFPDVHPITTLQLEMFGFPGDQVRKSQATKSFNCEVQSADLNAPMDNFYQNFIDRGSAQQNQETRNKQSDLFKLKARYVQANMIPLRHNCDTFAGNSGGPIVLAGTNLLIGLPASYNPTMQVFGRDKFGFMETPWRLIQNQRNQFINEKINVKTIDRGVQQRLQGPPIGSAIQSSQI